MRLFISYAHADRDRVRRLVDVLRDAQHDPWFDEHLKAGHEWKPQLHDAIEASDVFVYALTPASVASEWCEWEFVTAIKLGKPVLPVLLEDTDLPEVWAQLHYVDVRTGFRKRKIQQMLTHLADLVITIPEAEAPTAPAEPQGVPARAVNVQQNVTMGDVSGGSVNVIGHIGTQIGTQVIGEKQRNWTIPVVLGLLFAFISVVVGVVALLPEGDRNNALHQVGLLGPSDTPTATPSATPPPTVTPTSTPGPMPADSFNVVVAGFGYEQTDGTITRDPMADDMSDIVLNTLADLAQVNHILGWRSNGVEHILSPDPRERERQAAQIAKLLNADVVIYGIVRDNGVRGEIEPEFYVAAKFSNIEPELQGAEAFGKAINFVTGSDDLLASSTELKRRMEVLRFFLRGLALYISGDFTGSVDAFKDAQASASEGLEVISIFAGNAALRLEDNQTALAFYDAALTTRPDYARALIGRGNVLYQLTLAVAGTEPPPYDAALELPAKRQCAQIDEPLPEEPQLMIDLALRCYNEATLSQDKPLTADVDVKIALGLGQLKFWQSYVGYGEYWDEVETHLQTVIDLYQASGPERQARIRALAAHAHAWLGLRLIVIDGSDVAAIQQALTYYETAVALLENDVNVEYNQAWIDTYNEQIESLRETLRQRGVDRTPTPTETGAEFK